MHDPYECYPILKLGSTVDSFAAFGDSLLVGAKPAHLIRYSIKAKDKEKDSKLDVQLLRYYKNFCKRAIQQIQAIPQRNLIVILSENTVFVHDLSSANFPLISTMQKTKGANIFYLDIENLTDASLTRETSFICRMCVAVKRKLQLYYWKNNEFLSYADDISISDFPKSIVWCKQSICVGLRNEYILVKLDDKKDPQTELFPAGKNSEPIVIKFDDSTFALVKDSQSVFINIDGTLMSKNAVKWSEVPQALIYDEPYLIALLSETIEIRSVQPALLVQTIKIEKPQLICRAYSGVLYVASGVHLSIIQAIPVAKQIKILIDEKQFQLALKLCNVWNDDENEKAKKRYHIQTLYAFDLFNNKQYSEAMKQFLELDSDPYDVIRLFPSLLPQYSQDDSPVSDGPSGKIGNRDFEKSLPALIEYLTAVRLKLLDNKKSQKRSVTELEQTFQIIDTTLLKCYLHTNDALIAPLIRLNNCHVLDSERVLKKHKKYAELILLYETKGLHHRALELLQKQAEQSDSPSKEVEKMIQYLQRLGKENIDLILKFAGWIVNNYPDEGLQIFVEDTSEVMQLPRLKILDFLVKTNKSLVIPYLEHLIYIWKDTDSSIHNALAHQYREKVLTLLNFPNGSEDQSTDKSVRNKLLNFLEKSEYYTPETLCAHFPFDSLFEERAILFGKLGQHEKALAIYVTVLGDTAKAIEYCENVYSRGGVGSDMVYVHLLQLLINPPDGTLLGAIPSSPTKPDIDMALALLEGNATRIPPEKALKILPKDIPVHKIRHFLVMSLNEHLNKKRHSQISRGLVYAEFLQVHDLRINYESQVMVLHEYNFCAVCNKRFSKQCAFFKNPNGDLVHLSCQQPEKS
ncbi:hypothetical protein V9T40_002277 [Parthenolecanium corni]|uniref:CNH domain-containing protein n=1 Tax=Parthenolecanium corni TaxID=536013 RepID=A0AAN9TI59_9HEMI